MAEIAKKFIFNFLSSGSYSTGNQYRFPEQCCQFTEFLLNSFRQLCFKAAISLLIPPYSNLLLNLEKKIEQRIKRFKLLMK